MNDRPAATDAATTSVEQTSGRTGTGARGTIRVAPAVLIELIELTVSGIDGVVELRPRPKRTRAAQPFAGKAYDDGKVRVGVIDDRIEADIAVSVTHGTNIAVLSRTIQQQVGRAVERMLGMTADTVNIYIDDIQPAPNTDAPS